MRKQKLLAFLLSIALYSCAPKSIESYHTAENEEQIIRLLNQREYSMAVWLIESQHGKTPADRSVAFLLGQAYLGVAGFEPLRTAAKVSAAQNFSSSEARQLFPECPQESLSNTKTVNPVCLLKRVYLHFPDADLYAIDRARELFRYAYPSAETTPEWANVLIGTVETASVVKRAGRIYLIARSLDAGRQEPNDEELRWMVAQARKALTEASQAISRATYAGNKISQLLSGNRDSPWFKQVKDGVTWADRLGLGPLFDLLRADLLKPEDEIRYGELLNKIRALIDEQDKRLGEN